MSTLNPAAWIAWAALIALPIGFGLLAVMRLGTSDKGDSDAGH